MKKILFFIFASMSLFAQKKAPMKNYVQSPILVNDFYTGDKIIAQLSQKGGVAIRGISPNLFAEENASVEIMAEAVDYETVTKKLVMNLETLIGDGLEIKMVRNAYQFELKAVDNTNKALPNVTFEIVENTTKKRVDVANNKAMLLPKESYTVVAVAEGYSGAKLLVNAKELLLKKQRVIEVELTESSNKQAFTNAEKGKAITLNNIFFDQGKADLKAESYQELDALYNFLTTSPNVRIEIKGYTDNAGDWDLNVQLSKDRCQAVANYLTQKGIDKNRLQIVGKGPTDAISPNTSEENRRKNRRVTFTVL